MKIVRFVSPQGERQVGMVDGGLVRSLGADGVHRIDQLVEMARAASGASSSRVALSDVRLLSPVAPWRNVMCVGMNYSDHVAEAAGQALSQFQDGHGKPVFFTKATGSVVGPSEPVEIDPGLSSAYDWEGELAVVIGRAGRDIAVADALSHALGYTIANDVSVRDIQFAHGNQWFKGKSIDQTCPMGPWLVTADEIPDPQALAIELRVNGIVKQYGNTADMIFSVADVIAELSRGMTLEPGDVVLTGTPAGVGFTRQPPEYLEPGDVVEINVEQIGTLRHYVTLQGRNEQAQSSATGRSAAPVSVSTTQN